MDRQEYYKVICNDEQQLLSDIKELQRQLMSVCIIKERLEREMSSLPNLTPFTMPALPVAKRTRSLKFGEGRYRNPDRSPAAWEKTLSALVDLKEGSTLQVSKRMTKLYPKYTEERALKDAKYYLSLLRRKGKIWGYRIPGTSGFLYKIL